MKKLISCFLVLCLIAGTSLMAVAASAGEGEPLEASINAVKKVIDIPAAYTSFSQERYENETEGVMWRLYWSDPDGNSISATVNDAGEIIAIDHYYDYNRTPSQGISDYTYAEGAKMAEAFLQKVWPEIAGDMRLTDDPYNNVKYTDEHFYYTFKLYKNDLPVDFVTATVTADKFRKTVNSYYRAYVGDISDITYQDAFGLAGKDEAGESFIKTIGLDTEYFSYFDDKAQKMNIFAAYVLNDTYGKAIDAKTGNLVNLFDGIAGADGRGGAAEAMSANASNLPEEDSLTPQEQVAVDTAAKLISGSEAEKIARETLGLATTQKASSSNLNNDYYFKKNYTWNIYYNNLGRVSVNAKTGEVTSFYNYEETGKGDMDLKADAAKKIAEDFLRSMVPDKLPQTKYVNDERYFVLADGAKVSDIGIFPPPKPTDEDVYYFSYARQVNGMSFTGNGMTVNVDRSTGKVTGYNLTWYEDVVTFPAVTGSITKEEAFRLFDASSEYAVSYKLTDRTTAMPVYDFVRQEGVLLDPKTGKRLDWTGRPYVAEGKTEYTDIKGHWAESTILSLVENGYYLSAADNLFRPDENITQLNFFLYCYGNYAASDIDYLYNRLIRDGVITEAEKNPNGAVTRKDAAKYLARMMGFEKIASKPELFNYPLDEPVEDLYKGYITVVCGLDIMSGTEDGRFHAEDRLTNAQSAAVVYNYLNVR